VHTEHTNTVPYLNNNITKKIKPQANEEMHQWNFVLTSWCLREGDPLYLHLILQPEGCSHCP